MKKKKLVELEKKWSERDMLQEYLDGLEAEKERKNTKDSIIILFGFAIILILLVFGLRGCARSLHEQKVEDAGKTIEQCEDNRYFSSSHNAGETCDDARKIYNHYSEEEWRKEKKQLIWLGEVTEHDQLYRELKEELIKEGNYY